MIDFTSPAQKRKRERQIRIVNDFRKFKEETGYANCRIIQAMADSGDYGYTSFNTIQKVIKTAQVI